MAHAKKYKKRIKHHEKKLEHFRKLLETETRNKQRAGFKHYD